MIEIIRVSGKSVLPYLAEVARLRIEVFREFPYLYEGDESYERDYLQIYAKSDNSVIVLAIKDGEIIGASTGLPLAEADEAFQKPFLEAGIDPAAVFYFGESVLKRSERGQGIGHQFFDHREIHADVLGFTLNAFCAVERPHDHPLKPAGYHTNDLFWIKRGYAKHPGLSAELEWKQVGEEREILNRLIFWTNRQI